MRTFGRTCGTSLCRSKPFCFASRLLPSGLRCASLTRALDGRLGGFRGLCSLCTAGRRSRQLSQHARRESTIRAVRASVTACQLWQMMGLAVAIASACVPVAFRSLPFMTSATRCPQSLARLFDSSRRWKRCCKRRHPRTSLSDFEPWTGLPSALAEPTPTRKPCGAMSARAKMQMVLTHRCVIPLVKAH